MEGENLRNSGVVMVLVMFADGFVFLPLLIYVAEEGIIKEENLNPFAIGLMVFQFVVLVILMVRATIKDSR